MMRPHIIRLHAAWKRMVPGTEQSESVPVSVSLPDQSLLLCDAPCVVYRRGFNRPTGIGPRTAVLLDCGLVALGRPATLNGQILEMPPAQLLEISSLLRPHNELQIVLHRDQFAEASGASACLQILQND